MHGRVLIVAGSDSGGGAGIQADIKTVTALGGYAASAITALTVQDTRTVHAVHPVPPEFITAQMRVVLEDIGADCIKTGMLHDVPVIEAVAGELERSARTTALVVDPVMVAKGGARLLDAGAAGLLAATLVRHATVLTPNLPEAGVLLGRALATVQDMRAAVDDLRGLGAGTVLLKGGHLAGARVIDLLITADGVEEFDSARIDTPHTHGTGCTLASAIATGLAQGLGVRAAVVRAREYVAEAIRRAPGYGQGHGPLDHAHTVRAPR